MTKLLMRGGVPPTKRLGNEEQIKRDYTGANTGNLLYLNGIYRNLNAEGVEIDVDGYQPERGKFTDEDIARVNETYDAYVLPLANAFRTGFIPKLEALTRVVRGLTIPCVITGIGIQQPYEPNFGSKRKFDDAAKAFIAAVLEKSSVVGTRGVFTCEYLEHLGFKAGTYTMPIGCPSMYAYGGELSTRRLFVRDDPRIAINFGMRSNEAIRNYLLDLARQDSTAVLVAQDLLELRRTYFGCDRAFPGYDAQDALPERFMYDKGRVKVFINAAEWIASMENIDLSLGGRIHGNIAATLGGAAAVVIAPDARTRELADFHGLPLLSEKDVKPRKRLSKLVKHLDFSEPARRQPENYRNFTEFLEKNGLPHCDSAELASSRPAPLELATTGVPSYATASAEERSARDALYEKIIAPKL